MLKLRVGIIGAGMAFERLHYPAYQELPDRYEIKAICDEDKRKADYWAKKLILDNSTVYSDYKEMVKRDDLDVIDIMAPIGMNYRVTHDVASLLTGSHKSIICEKPLAATMDEAKAAAELPQKYHVPIMIAENYRYNEEINIIRDYVGEKRIGETFYFVQNRVVDFLGEVASDRFPSAEWRQRPDFPGGAILDTGVHEFAALRHIFGAIDKVQAFGQHQSYDYAPYSVICVNMLFKSGVIGTFSFFCSGKEVQRPLVGLRIFGASGMIYLEERNCGTVNVAHNNGDYERIPYRPQRGFFNELLNFYQAASGNEPISVTPEMEFGDTYTVLQILKSIGTDEIIWLDKEAEYKPDYGAIHRNTAREPRAGKSNFS
ncbi:MAG TPA: oxidoreductase [Desulfotomaculum sp.]|nr:MAG: Oxidoreductase, n-terminal:oxidoreductase, c-terminal, putative [Desulfotomaculum sp. 46_80]HAG12111.1 oxidoreductase [Desulfotomaculum sp.]HBY04932.1 oxidoreductase [Desulfotomaculum sp.]